MWKEPEFQDTVLFNSHLVCVGAFRCDADYAGFGNTGPASHDCFVFPRTAVAIEHEHDRPFAANPNVVTFYNRDQRYLRHRISQAGDRCDWFAVDRRVAQDIVATLSPAAGEHPFGPFAWTRGPCDPQTYLLQRGLFDKIARGNVDPLAVEESVVMLLERVVSNALRDPRPRRNIPIRRDLVHDVECLVSARFEQSTSLGEIARETGSSPYHLCRAFRKGTGMSLHQYRQHLRIRHGLERVCDSSEPLSRIAVDLGFAHHSHFTNVFRRGFGCTPSALRRD